MTKILVVANDSCGEELEQFVGWMNKNHSDVETIIETIDRSSYTVDGIETEEYFWDEYCRA